MANFRHPANRLLPTRLAGLFVRDLPDDEMSTWQQGNKDAKGVEGVLMYLQTFARSANGEAFEEFESEEGWTSFTPIERDDILDAMLEAQEAAGKKMEMREQMAQERASKESADDGSGETE